MRFFDAAGDGGSGGDGSSGDGQQQNGGGAAAAEWSWVTPEGKLNDGWLDHLPDDVKPQGTAIAGLVDKYQGSLPALLKGALHLQSVAGKKLGAPSADWTPEQIAEYRAAHGIPESADKYDLTPPEGALPEGWEWNPETFAPMREWALKNHVSAAALKEWTGVQAKVDKARQQAAIQMIEERDTATREELKKEFGPTNFEARLERASRAASVLGIDTDVQTNPIANHPVFIKLLDRVAEQMGESKLVTGATTPTAKPGAVRAKDIMEGRDPLSADYSGKNGPERQDAAWKLVRDLLEQAEKQ